MVSPINRFRAAGLATAAALAATLAGCGGGLQDFGGGASRGIGGDISNGYGGSLGGTRSPGTQPAAGLGRGVFPRIETSFQLPDVKGDPYDFEKVNVQVTLKQPDGTTVDVPCFFDGGTTWRMRFTPNAPGPYAVVSVKLNREIAHEDKIEKKDWTVGGEPLRDFLDRHSRRRRLLLLRNSDRRQHNEQRGDLEDAVHSLCFTVIASRWW